MPCRSYLPCWSQWNFSVWQSTFLWYFCTAKLYFDLLVAVNSIGYWQTQISFVPPLASFHVFLLYKKSSCKQSVNTFWLGDAIFCILRELVDIKQKYECVSGLEYFVLKMLDFLHWPELLIFTCSWLTFFVFIVCLGPSFIKLVFSFLVISLTEPLDSFALCAVFSCQWYDTDALEQMPLPMHYEGNVTDFQKLLLLRCFRVDRMYRAVTDYVTVTMGET